MTKDLAKEITQPLLPITEGIQKAIQLVKYPSIQAAEQDDQDPNTSMLYIGEVAEKYLRHSPIRKRLIKHLDCMTKMGSFSSVIVTLR